MKADYGRNLDLNLLRVFLAVAEHGSVTAAAKALYLTQPAISAALRRLTDATGAKLFAREGRGLTLTSRGRTLLESVRPHLMALVEAALAPQGFSAKTSDRIVRLGVSDSIESWLLPELLRTLAKEAPLMRVVAIPVQFRNVGEVIAQRRVDCAITVADELPSSIHRQPLFTGGFVCVFDPRHVKLGPRPTERAYFEAEHVVVSYNADLRGIVEDLLHKQRRVRCSVSTFAYIGSIVEGSSLVATLPELVAEEICRRHPRLRTGRLPFKAEATSVELLWPAADEDDPAGGFIRRTIASVCAKQLG